MTRRALIVEFKKLLDDGSKPALDRVIELATAHNLEFPDVCERARLARVRIMEGGPVGRADSERWLRERAQAGKQARIAERVARDGRVVVKEGHFTVVLADGHVTFKVERQDANASFAAGELIVSRLTGPNNESDYHGVAFAKDDGRLIVWKKHRGDARLQKALDVLSQNPKAAAVGYAKQSGRCYICGRLLTEPASIELGVGPVCRDRGY